MKNKKKVKFAKYQVFKHTTESKKKNMVGNNPEVQKKKALNAALSPEYKSTSDQGEITFGFEYSQPVPEKKETGDQQITYTYTLPLEPPGKS